MAIKHLNEKLREAYIAGTLSEEETVDVEEHLLTCPACYTDYNVDLPRERELRAFTQEHLEIGREAVAALRGPGLKVRLSQVADAVREGVDEARAVLERFLEGARMATLVPQMATIRQAGDTALVIDQICRDYVMFSGSGASSGSEPQGLELTSRVRLEIHYVAKDNALRIRVPEGSGGQLSSISIRHTQTGQELGVIRAQADETTFDIPLDLLTGDVSLSFQ